jgi:hypothetical protein
MIHENSITANGIPDKAQQRRMIAHCVRDQAMTRNEIAAQLRQIPLTSICGRVAEMKRDGLLVEVGNQIVEHALASGGTRKVKRSLLKIANQPEKSLQSPQ